MILRWWKRTFGDEMLFVNPLRVVQDEVKERAGKEAERREKSREKMDEALERAKQLLGEKYILNPNYKSRGISHEDFLKQPPMILESWRRIAEHPNDRAKILHTREGLNPMPPVDDAPIPITRKNKLSITKG